MCSHATNSIDVWNRQNVSDAMKKNKYSNKLCKQFLTKHVAYQGISK
jgi:hypothetical protein